MAKSRKSKPSFDAPPAAAGAAAAATPEWVYRSETPAPEPASGATAPAGEEPPARAGDGPARTDAPPASDRARGAHAIIERYAAYSAAAGLVPVPAVDAAAIAGVQVQMLRALAAHYGVAFSQERGKSLIAALIGGAMPSLAGYQFLKLAGPLAGILGISGFAMTSTWAVGRVFAAHFETGGTLVDFSVERAAPRVAAALTRS